MSNKSSETHHFSKLCERLAEYDAVKDWVATTEYLILKNNSGSSQKTKNTQGLITAIKKCTNKKNLVNYLESYVVTQITATDVPFLLPIIKYLPEFDRGKLPPSRLAELVSESEKPNTIETLSPKFLSLSKYNHYTIKGFPIKRRKTLEALMSDTSIKDLQGVPNSFVRACDLAIALAFLIRHRSLSSSVYDQMKNSWHDDVAFLKYRYVDCVLHVRGITWPTLPKRPKISPKAKAKN
jgi:hypothetical protein